MNPISFKHLATDGRARRGEAVTTHGTFQTPAFMAVGTQATVKGLTPPQIGETGTEVVLGNTYHLNLRPGSERIQRLGGLHKFMGWSGPILTDSGGFQVFSLSELRKTTDEGVVFKSHIDGSMVSMTPERSIQIQAELGSDIAMAFDDCAPYPASRDEVEAAMGRTHRWAERCLDVKRPAHQALFGIVQGGVFPDLRRESAGCLTQMPFDGFALGGLSVGESKDEMALILGDTTELLPKEKLRYLMGVGTPADLVLGIGNGIDMFDCVMPTRNARNGCAFTSEGKVVIKQAQYRDDESPLDPDCSCYTCHTYSRAYLHHVNRAQEMISGTLLSLHNLTYYQSVMNGARQAIEKGQFEAFAAQIASIHGETQPILETH
ncbi:MAG: tRNA guanosine(34) transglycosylase Tgt [Acidobacteria bacterium]|nr:tRNA guanosine(34) transglycosylase Tgt [Acidobacteriota bacterium]